MLFAAHEVVSLSLQKGNFVKITTVPYVVYKPALDMIAVDGLRPSGMYGAFVRGYSIGGLDQT